MCDHIRRLAEIRDSWRAGNFVDQESSEYVAQQFILPNFLTHFAAVTDGVICFRERRLTADFTNGDLLHIWSADPANPETRAELERLLQQLTTEEEWGLSQYHPWRCIDRWLLLQVCVSRMPGPKDLPVGHCWRLLLDVFNERNEHFRAAFQTWMDQGSKWLNGALTDLIGKLAAVKDCLESYTTIRNTLGQVPASFLQQNKAVAGRRADNYEEVRRGSLIKNKLLLPEPIDEKWLRSVASKLTIAANAGSGFRWEADNQAKLRQLLAWIEEREIEQGNPAPIEPLRTLARLPPPATIAWNDSPVTPTTVLTINELRSAWSALLLLVRTRWRRKGYRDDWGDCDRVLEDLFCHPLMTSFSFENWRSEFEG